MNHRKTLGFILLNSFCLLVFIFAAVVFIPALRQSVGKFLLSFNTTLATDNLPTQTHGLTANAVSADTSATASATDSTATPVSTSAGTSSYEYKLLKIVDQCQLNTLGAQGFQAIQFGGTIDISTGRDADCGKWHTVDVLDWVLFAREK